jgi:proteasome lid subunit RPN8/RPN11
MVGSGAMEDRIVMSERAREALRDEARRARPAECCGLLAGQGARVEVLYPVPNAAEDPSRRYEMDPAELWAARRAALAAGYEVLGFYHSHPRTPPVPSSLDVERAYYPEAVYAIAGLEPDFTVRAFRIAGGRASELSVEVEA